MSREPNGMFISQKKYVIDILKETGKLGAKPAKTPIEEGYKDVKIDEMWPDVKQYQRMVGKLIYLTITRPDICFAVNRVSQHMQAPKTHHWNMVERILRYLKGNPGKGIWLKCNGNTQVEAYCDADWAGDKLDRKSTTGYCTFVGGNLVTWRSKKQKVIALSSAEAEYRAMKEVTKEMVWLKSLLRDLGVHVKEPMNLYCDNQAAIHIASNPVFHERTKHIEVDCHFVRGKIQEGLIEPMFVKSGEQMADIFTKATTQKVCEYVHDKIGLWDPLRPTLRGSVEKTHHTHGICSHGEKKEDRPDHDRLRPNGDQPRPKEIKPTKTSSNCVRIGLGEAKDMWNEKRIQNDQDNCHIWENRQNPILTEKTQSGLSGPCDFSDKNMTEKSLSGSGSFSVKTATGRAFLGHRQCCDPSWADSDRSCGQMEKLIQNQFESHVFDQPYLANIQDNKIDYSKGIQD